ncbi:uncharacterized protein F58A4.6 [Euwallacea similis]|uniref:uncharacterized protein F58A4.6 n=1 Tax=Euwallacea similis TaxID=1736056 RepID=UPI00344B9921
MSAILWVLCSPKCYMYDKLELQKDSLSHMEPRNFIFNKRHKRVLELDCVFVHYFIQELSLSQFYRTCVIWNVHSWRGPDILLLVPTKRDLIDYNWNERMYELARERCEIDHAFSWLSTLGGAFSALGDYFAKCADTAGKISFHQLKLAFRIGDPNMQARCRLYLALSLIQKKRFALSAKIIRKEFQIAKRQTVVDERLVKMCKGIWAKLQYEHSLYMNNKKIKR